MLSKTFPTETRFTAMGDWPQGRLSSLSVQVRHQSDGREEPEGLLPSPSSHHCQHHLLRGHVQQAHDRLEGGAAPARCRQQLGHIRVQR